MPLFISRSARNRLRLGDELFDGTGRLDLFSPGRARQLAARLGDDAGAVSAAGLAALDRLAAVFEELIALYRRRVRADAFDLALRALYERFGRAPVDELLARFAEEFGLAPPPLSAADPGGREPARTGTELLRRLLLFWVLDGNAAARGLLGTLHETTLRGEPLYQPIIASLRQFFQTQPPLEEGGTDLVEVLLEPARAEPGSLAGQLRFVYARWGSRLGRLAPALLRGIDQLEEEERPRFGPGPGPAEMPSYVDAWTQEVRSFTADRDWMAAWTLVAKNSYVWLGQLSRRYGRPIERLDQVPREALDELAEHGFRGLWLIGLWERSRASARIKQLCGNPEAVGSAYSLRRYRIAEALGGDGALERLAELAARSGIRLAADMVPNHMAIDSDWLLRHPDWFIGLDECPYPNYSFDGPDLSPDPSVGIYVEDHYFDRSDAAVVFKRVDRETGRERYIYHGNDGTSTPWNDTAQLDFLQPRVREAVMQTVVDVGRRFPAIRFDAAMTLTRKHFQRLWYPPPGSGGAIPTRAENGLGREEFDAAMPHEFWRELVDRVAREAPDTLLLAEAFWLMEGYFVRSLGMHRVYNSAFMNMLRDGETGRYRRLIRETLAFDPEILKRYVNFMSNPDERTARDQFGDGDRYFGVCAVMSALPGLPMFAHGQVEGLREKYGMEYRQAYWDERPDRDLVARHEREIVPLLRRRHLFAEAERFRLFDLTGDGGRVHEEVLAFSNGSARERELVVFNNGPVPARGRLRTSAPFRAHGESQRTEELAEALAMGGEPGQMVRFRDDVAGLDYLVEVDRLQRRGLELSLRPYEYRTLRAFEAIDDDEERTLRAVARRLDGAGVPSLEEAVWHLRLEQWQVGLDKLLDDGRLTGLLPGDPERLRRPADDELLLRLEEGWRGLVASAAGRSAEEIAEPPRARLLGLVTLPVLAGRLAESQHPGRARCGDRLQAALARSPELMVGLYLKICVDEVARRGVRHAADGAPITAWGAEAALVRRLESAGVERRAAEGLAGSLAAVERLGWGASAGPPSMPDAAGEMARICQDEAGRRVLTSGADPERRRHARRGLVRLLDVGLSLQAVAWSAAAPGGEPVETLRRWLQLVEGIERIAEAADYRLERLQADPAAGSTPPA